MPSGRHGSSGGGGIHSSRAWIHPVKHTRSSSKTHSKTGHSTHSTRTTQQHRTHARKYSARLVTRDALLLKNERDTHPLHTNVTNELARCWVRGAPHRRDLPSPVDPRLACRLPRCHTYFLHSNFSSTIFMFEEYFSRIGDIRSNRYVLSGDVLWGVVGVSVTVWWFALRSTCPMLFWQTILHCTSV